MKKTLLFVHGFGSDRNSRKFQDLKSHFGKEYHCHCLEWTVFSDIPYLLNLALHKCAIVERLVIIGDSTGANLAYQLREMRNSDGDKLILLSPLLDIAKRKRDIPFPATFCEYLLKIANPANTLVIASKTDEVIDQQSLFDEADKKFTLMEVNDGHRLEKFHDYLHAIEEFINE